MKLSLFRKEAIDHQRQRLSGDIILTQPIYNLWIIMLVFIILIISGLFLYHETYSRKETVSGYLLPSKGQVRLYGDTPGIISKLQVKPGDLVKHGDVIATILLERKQGNGRSEQEQIKASLIREKILLEQKIKARPGKLAHDHAVANERLANLKKEKTAIIRERRYAQERKDIAHKSVLATEKLVTKGIAPKSQINDRRTRLISAEQSLANLERQLISATNAINDQSDKIAQLDIQYRDNMSGLNTQLEALVRNLAQIENQTSYQITASVSGTVSALLFSEGERLNITSPLAILTPENSHLIARLLVPSKASGLISAGMPVRLQYDAFPYQRFGLQHGTVKHVNDTVVAPGEIQLPVTQDQAVYLVDVQLNQQTIKASGRHIYLKPGLLLRADVTLESRSLIEWLFDPIYSLYGRL